MVFGYIEDGIIVVDKVAGKYYKLNETEREIWVLSDGSRTIDQIVETIYKEYDATLEIVKEDVTQALEKLKKKGLIILDKEKKLKPYVKPEIVTITAEDVMRSVMKPGIIAMRSFIGG
jgi:biotin operon repressor